MSAEKQGATVLNVGKKFVSSRMAGACGTDENGDVIAPPIYAFGASSGGAIIAKLASKMEEEPEKYRPFIFSAINVQIYGEAGSRVLHVELETLSDATSHSASRVQPPVSSGIGILQRYSQVGVRCQSACKNLSLTLLHVSNVFQ